MSVSDTLYQVSQGLAFRIGKNLGKPDVVAALKQTGRDVLAQLHDEKPPWLEECAAFFADANDTVKTGYEWALESNVLVVDPAGWVAEGLTLDSLITKPHFAKLVACSRVKLLV